MVHSDPAKKHPGLGINCELFLAESYIFRVDSIWVKPQEYSARKRLFVKDEGSCKDKSAVNVIHAITISKSEDVRSDIDDITPLGSPSWVPLELAFQSRGPRKMKSIKKTRMQITYYRPILARRG